MYVLRGLMGIVVLLAVAWLLSSNRRRFPVRTIVGGLAIQWVLALVVLHTNIGQAIFNGIGHGVTVLLDCTDAGTRFVLGNLVDVRPDAWGVVFAAKALPAIIVFASLSALGYHLGILQFVVGIMARVMTWLMGVSGAESLSAAGNAFLGQTEAPLLVRPYIGRMTQSELMALMVGGFATIAGGVMAAYIAILGGDDPQRRIEVARHFLTACLMSAPASLIFAKVMVPETGVPETAGTVRLKVERTTKNVVHAAAVGAGDGLYLALNVAAMLIVFIALIALIDRCLAAFGNVGIVAPAVQWLGLEKLNLAGILGLIFYPIAWLIGVDTGECRTFGGLLGTAMAANEFVAYLSLSQLVADQAVSERTLRLAMYSLCGFANFSSIAIQIAGIGGMAPERKGELARLGLRAMLAGAMACWMTGCIAGILT
jgi:CNT family concentrative nucleoside transporter